MIEIELALHSYSLVQHFRRKPGFGVFDFVALAADRGFTGINLNLNRPDWRHLTGQSPEHLVRVGRLLAERGMSLEVDTSGTDPHHLRALLLAARALGARNLRTYTRHRGSHAAVWERTLADLRAAVADAERAGIPLVLENHEEFTGPALAALVEAVGSPWLRVLFDYGNSQPVWEDPQACLEALLPLSATMHLKDHLILRPEHAPDGRLSTLGVAIGQGALPIMAMTRRLVAAGHRRLVFENVWAYRAPFAPPPAAPAVTLGQGSFRYAEPPFEELRVVPDQEAAAAADLEAFLAAEIRALDEGLAWLRAACAAEGWRLRQAAP